MAAYQRLIALLTPKVAEEFFRIFPARKKKPEKWALALKKRAQEVARYVLPIGTFAHLYHTVSGPHAAPLPPALPAARRADRGALVVQAMVDEVTRGRPALLPAHRRPAPAGADARSTRRSRSWGG